MARNRKRAKERRARRPQGASVGAPGRLDRDAVPDPIEHATPDAELAEAQLALGRPDVARDSDRETTRDDASGDADTEPDTEADTEPDTEADVERDAEADVEADTEADVEFESDEGVEPFEDEEFGEVGPAIPGVLPGTVRVETDQNGVAEDVVEAPAAAVPAERRHAGNRLINFLRGSWHELQRVQWPDRRQVMQATGVVIGFVIVAGVFLGVADFLAGKLMNYILK